MGFNTVDYSVGGILPYHFWSVIGVTISLSVSLFLYKYKRLNIMFALKTVICSAPCILIGALLFGSIYTIIKDISLDGRINIENIFHGGIVYYGGLTGFVLMYKLLWRKKENVVREASMDIAAIMITLFHFFGRIGCFTAGCCYGIKTDSPMGIIYTNLIDGVAVTERRIPIQLVEAVFELLLSIVFITLFFIGKLRGKLLYLYFVIYPIFRFFAEFYRGDWNRRAFQVLSLSQIYSLILIIIALTIIVRARHKEATVI